MLGSIFDLDIGNSSGAPTISLLMSGTGRMTTPTSFGGTLMVGARFSVIEIPSTPAGGLSIPVGVPNSTFLCNVCLHMQVVQADPGASHGVSFSRGLSLILGR